MPYCVQKQVASLHSSFTKLKGTPLSRMNLNSLDKQTPAEGMDYTMQNYMFVSKLQDFIIREGLFAGLVEQLRKGGSIPVDRVFVLTLREADGVTDVIITHKHSGKVLCLLRKKEGDPIQVYASTGQVNEVNNTKFAFAWYSEAEIVRRQKDLLEKLHGELKRTSKRSRKQVRRRSTRRSLKK
jgi:hypothetical protein